MPSPALENLLILYARHFPLRRGKLRIVDALWRTAIGERDTRRLAHLNHGGFRMECDVSEILQRQFYFFGTYFLEDALLACWERAARNAAVVFDIGANAGIYSLAAAAAQPHATIHAFEPTPEIAERLRKTVAANGLHRVHVHEVAVSAQSGSANLVRFRGELGTNGGMNYITTTPADPELASIRTVSLDDFCAEHAVDRIDLLKMDIQGHEPRALEGAAGLLSSGSIGTIFTELNWAAKGVADCPASAAVRILDDAGYRFSEPGPQLQWRKSGSWMRALSDVLARRPAAASAA
jgi:FkbM family methyltransferase